MSDNRSRKLQLENLENRLCLSGLQGLFALTWLNLLQQPERDTSQAIHVEARHARSVPDRASAAAERDWDAPPPKPQVDIVLARETEHAPAEIQSEEPDSGIPRGAPEEIDTGERAVSSFAHRPAALAEVEIDLSSEFDAAIREAEHAALDLAVEQIVAAEEPVQASPATAPQQVPASGRPASAVESEVSQRAEAESASAEAAAEAAGKANAELAVAIEGFVGPLELPDWQARLGLVGPVVAAEADANAGANQPSHEAQEGAETQESATAENATAANEKTQSGQAAATPDVRHKPVSESATPQVLVESDNDPPVDGNRSEGNSRQPSPEQPRIARARPVMIEARGEVRDESPRAGLDVNVVNDLGESQDSGLSSVRWIAEVEHEPRQPALPVDTPEPNETIAPIAPAVVDSVRASGVAGSTVAAAAGTAAAVDAAIEAGLFMASRSRSEHPLGDEARDDDLDDWEDPGEDRTPRGDVMLSKDPMRHD